MSTKVYSPLELTVELLKNPHRKNHVTVFNPVMSREEKTDVTQWLNQMYRKGLLAKRMNTGEYYLTTYGREYLKKIEGMAAKDGKVS